MNDAQKEFVLHVLQTAKDLTLATVRPDGYPQATTVSFAHDGLAIYIGVGQNSQKARNIRQNNKVSLTVNLDYDDWNHIKGLSMAATAKILSDPEEIRRAGECIIKRFPQVEQWAKTGALNDTALIKLIPGVISLLDYEKGFGHTELVTV